MTAHLENWSVIGVSNDPYASPEMCVSALSGAVTNHPQFPDGAVIQTSQLKMIDIPNKKARTRSRDYTLGEPDPKWVDWLTSQGKKLEDFGISGETE